MARHKRRGLRKLPPELIAHGPRSDRRDDYPDHARVPTRPFRVHTCRSTVRTAPPRRRLMVMADGGRHRRGGRRCLPRSLPASRGECLVCSPCRFLRLGQSGQGLD